MVIVGDGVVNVIGNFFFGGIEYYFGVMDGSFIVIDLFRFFFLMRFNVFSVDIYFFDYYLIVVGNGM